MHIVIGMPVYNRGWVLPRWFDSLFKQGVLRKNITLLFGITDSHDNTRDIIDKYASKVSAYHYIDCNDLPAFGDRNSGRFYPLTEIRNRLLEKVIEISPDYYLSWDSDIILPDKALKQLIADDKDVVSPYVELMSGAPNCVSRIPGTNAFRRVKPIASKYPKDKFYPVDICFAVVLMKPVVYTVPYAWHQGGEDYGWGLNLLDAGVECWMDSRIECHHITKKDC